MHGASIDIDRLAFRKSIIDKNKSNKRSLFVDSNDRNNYETSLNINQVNEIEDKDSPVLVENLFTENNMPTVSSTQSKDVIKEIRNSHIEKSNSNIIAKIDDDTIKNNDNIEVAFSKNLDKKNRWICIW